MVLKWALEIATYPISTLISILKISMKLKRRKTILRKASKKGVLTLKNKVKN